MDKGFEKAQPLEGPERTAAWYQILASEGLINTHMRIQNMLSSDLDSQKSLKEDYTAYIQERDVVTEHVDDGASFVRSGLKTRKNEILIALADSIGARCQLRCMSDSPELTGPQETLFKVFSYIFDKTKANLMEVKNNSGRNPSLEGKSLYTQATALGSSSKITLDNIQTFFDVFWFVTEKAENIASQNHLIRTLLRERPSYAHKIDTRSIELNPQSETNMELTARAPFAFWGRGVRNNTPLTIGGASVINLQAPDGKIFTSDFVYLVTREHVKIHDPKEETVESLMRHGGCPIMHPDFKGRELITTFGETLSTYYQALVGAVDNSN